MKFRTVESKQEFDILSNGHIVYGVPFGAKVKISDHGIQKAKNVPISLIDLLCTDDYHQVMQAAENGEIASNDDVLFLISNSKDKKIYHEPGCDIHGDMCHEFEIVTPNTDKQFSCLMFIADGQKVQYNTGIRTIPSEGYLSLANDIISNVNVTDVKPVNGESIDRKYVDLIYNLFFIYKFRTNINVYEHFVDVPSSMFVSMNKSKYFPQYHEFTINEYQIFAVMLNLFRKNTNKMFAPIMEAIMS